MGDLVEPLGLWPSISADGRLMATASGFDMVRLYALPSRRPVGRPLRVSDRLRGRRDIGDVSLSPDGRTLAVTRPPAGGVEIRSVPTLERRASLPDAETIWDLARFTPDGRHVVGGSYKGWARLWSTENWKPASRKFTGHAGRVEWQSMSPDGRTLATGGPDGTGPPLGSADSAAARRATARPQAHAIRVAERAPRTRLRPGLLSAWKLHSL